MRPLENSGQYQDILGYKSDIADDFSIACGFIQTRTTCILNARYQEYYVYFSGQLSEEGKTQANFVDIMKYVDEKMRDILDR